MTAEVDRCRHELRLLLETKWDLGPGPVITLREFLRRLRDGELSYTWSVPEGVRRQAIPALQRWAQQTFDLERPVQFPRTLRWTIDRKLAG